jgi:thiamine pyrophosphate-dependent acetolactate synthase large subunit-like protein
MSVTLLDRRKAVATLLRRRGDALVVTGLGSATYDVAAAGDTPRNFYLWGAMGGAAVLALGVAVAQPEKQVFAVTGDGEMLMGMGSFSTIALQQPKNLTVVILDNGLYGETGAQQSHTARTDLAAVARACGIADVAVAQIEAEIETLAQRIAGPQEGPRVWVIKIASEEKPRLVPLREGAHAKVRFREALGLPAE